MKNYFDLTGRVAIVTGCSGGLGVQMAKALASQGCTIVPIARRQEKIEEVAKQLNEEFGVDTYPIRCDITDTDMVNDTVAKVMEKYGRIDILINNAGTGAVAPAEDISDEQFAHEMDIDLFGTFKVARAVAKQAMLPAGYGRIINIASTRFHQNEAGWEAYGASKGGLVSLTNSLCVSLSNTGITVNAISPGWIEVNEYNELSKNDHEQHPSGRVGKPEDILNACLFLSDPSNDFVNGLNLIVDGGMTKKMIYE